MDRRRRVLTVALAGVGYGVTTSALNALSSPFGELAGTWLQSGLRVLSTMTGAGWAWAALAVAAGWSSRSRRWGAAAGALALVAATTAYYGLDNVLREEPVVDSDILLWSAGAALLGPPLGVIGAYLGRPGPLGLLAALTVPVGAGVQVVVLPQGVGGVQDAPEAVWARWIVAGAAVVAVILVVRRWWATRGGRDGRDAEFSGAASSPR